MKLIPLGLNARKHRGYFAKVDDEDYEELMKYSWYASYANNTSSFYARRRDGRRMVRMHRQILKVSGGVEVDHINHDTLDNRKCNLRVCGGTQNQGNQRCQKGKSSKYKGVSLHRASNTWRAQIGSGQPNRKRLYLGSFVDEEDAARAYDAAALGYFGEFALLNFPKD